MASNDRYRGLYCFIVSLYPSPFRNRFQTELVQTYDDIASGLRDNTHSAYRGAKLRLIFNALGGAIHENLSQLANKDSIMSKSPKRDPHLGLKIGLISLGALVILIIGSVVFGFWSYNGPGGYVIRVIQAGQFITRFEGGSNVGNDDVTANFVADYIEAKYHQSGRTDVGFKSPHASQSGASKNGSTFTSLEETTKGTYTSTQPGFDPLICSSTMPTSVRYTANPGYNFPGFASVVAAFGYNNGPTTNLVQYTLFLDTSKSKQGDWKVISVNCLTLNSQPNRPYTTSTDESADFMTRNDRTF